MKNILKGSTLSNRAMCNCRLNNFKHIRLLSGSGMLFFLVPFFFVSCLKEPNHYCPPEYRVVLNVKDKNYSNINDINGLEAINEGLAFKEYVRNISYRLENLATGSIIVYTPNEVINDDEKSHTIEFPSLESGKYILAVMGNLSVVPDNSTGLLMYNLHPGFSEDMDTYLLKDTIEFSPESEVLNLDLERVKGNLTLFFSDLPDSVTRVDVQILDVYENVNEDSQYAGSVSVMKSFTQNLRPTGILQTFLAPTAPGKVSTLRIALFSQSSTIPYMIFPDILFNSYRNKITAFGLKVKPEGGLEIWQSINGVWTKLHDMDIQ